MLLVGNSVHKKGDRAQALKYLGQSTQLSPNNFSAVFALAMLYRTLGQPVEAVRNLEKSIHINSNAVEAHYELGLTWMDCGKLTDACDSFKKCITILRLFLKILVTALA